MRTAVAAVHQINRTLTADNAVQNDTALAVIAFQRHAVRIRSSKGDVSREAQTAVCHVQRTSVGDTQLPGDGFGCVLGNRHVQRAAVRLEIVGKVVTADGVGVAAERWRRFWPHGECPHAPADRPDYCRRLH